MSCTCPQAQIGAGSAIYAFSGQPQFQTVPITEDDRDHVFKAIVYNVLPTNSDEEGRVCLHSERQYSEIRDREADVLKKLQTVCLDELVKRS